MQTLLVNIWHLVGNCLKHEHFQGKSIKLSQSIMKRIGDYARMCFHAEHTKVSSYLQWLRLLWSGGTFDFQPPALFRTAALTDDYSKRPAYYGPRLGERPCLLIRGQKWCWRVCVRTHKKQEGQGQITWAEKCLHKSTCILLNTLDRFKNQPHRHISSMRGQTIPQSTPANPDKLPPKRSPQKKKNTFGV